MRTEHAYILPHYRAADPDRVSHKITYISIQISTNFILSVADKSKIMQRGRSINP